MTGPDPVFEPEVHAHSRAFLDAIDHFDCGRSFEDLDAVLQGLLMAAATIQVRMLEMPPDDLSIDRLTTAAYGQLTRASAGLLEEQAHRRALAARGHAGTPFDPEDDIP